MKKNCRGVKEIARKALKRPPRGSPKGLPPDPHNFGCEPSALGKTLGTNYVSRGLNLSLTIKDTLLGPSSPLEGLLSYTK